MRDVRFQIAPPTRVASFACQISLRGFAEKSEYDFNPQRLKNMAKYRDFPIQKGNRILFEENILTKYSDNERIDVSDMTLTMGAMQDKEDIHVTVIHMSEIEARIPDFSLEPEDLFSKFSELVGAVDIDFKEFPMFSKKYFLRSENEQAVRDFFAEPIMRFLENREAMHIECHKHKLLFYKKRDLMDTHEIDYCVRFAQDFIAHVPATAVLA